MTFSKGLLGEVSFKCKANNAQQRDLLLQNLKDNAKSDKIAASTWIHGYDPSPSGSIENFKHHFAAGSALGKIHAILEFFIDVALCSTLSWCDVKDITKENK